MQTMKRGPVALAYEDIGVGDAAPLLFVHGLGCDHTHFAPQQAVFGKMRRTVAVDLRGHGASDAPSHEYTVARFADDLLWQCRQLGLVKPIIVGHSMGGTIALELAARHPAAVSAVVLIDSALFPPSPMLQVLRELAEALRGAEYRSALGQALSMLFLPSDDPILRSRITASLMATPQHVLASALVHNVINYDAAFATTACRIPVAYVAAEVPVADLLKLRQLCPHLKVGQTLGSGHFATLFVPDQIIAMLQGFLRAYAQE